MGDNTGNTENPNAGSAGAPGLWPRVKDHRIAQWTVAYVGLAYAIQHAVVLTGEAFEWPQLVQRATMRENDAGFGWIGHCCAPRVGWSGTPPREG